MTRTKDDDETRTLGPGASARRGPWDEVERAALARRDAYALLEGADAAARVAELGVLETYYAVKALGPEDASPVLGLMTREQLVGLFDLDVWQGDHVSPSDLLVWLGALREVSTQKLADTVNGLDPELVAATFARRLLIARVVRDDDGTTQADWAANPPESLQPIIETPDRRFVIAARTEDALEGFDDDVSLDEIDEEERKQLLALVDTLYTELGPEVAGGILRLAETDLVADLEDTALRFRQARLEDLGFPDRTRAVELYAPLPPERLDERAAVEVPRIEQRLPALHAERLGRGLLRRALDALPEVLADAEASAATVERVELELVPLANAALVADRVEPGAIEQVAECLERVRAYLELGLAYGGADVSRAAERLARLPLRTIFGVGYGLTMRLATRARRLERERRFTAGQRFDLLGDRDRLLLDALLDARPRVDLGEGRRPFRGLDDVDQVAARLDALEALARAVDALGLASGAVALPRAVTPAEPRQRTIDAWLATVALGAWGRDAVRARALTRGELDALAPALAERTPSLDADGPLAALVRALPPDTVDAVRAALAPVLAELHASARALVARGERPDPRFLPLVVEVDA
jgi:hypothetical protein